MYLCFWREKNDAGEIVYTKSLLRNYILTRLHCFIESLGFSHNHVSAFIKLIWDMHGTQKKLIFYRHFMNPRIAVRIPIKQIERLWVSATRSYIKGDEKLMWLLKPAVSNLRNVRQIHVFISFIIDNLFARICQFLMGFRQLFRRDYCSCYSSSETHCSSF